MDNTPKQFGIPQKPDRWRIGCLWQAMRHRTHAKAWAALSQEWGTASTFARFQFI